MEREREKGSPSTLQDKTSKFQGDFSCPQVLHPLPSSRKSNPGVPHTGTLGRSIIPPLPSQQKWLPAGMKDGDSSSQRRLCWAAQEAQGGDRAQQQAAAVAGWQHPGGCRGQRGSHEKGAGGTS